MSEDWEIQRHINMLWWCRIYVIPLGDLGVVR